MQTDPVLSCSFLASSLQMAVSQSTTQTHPAHSE